jgi:hypothetical protein
MTTANAKGFFTIALYTQVTYRIRPSPKNVPTPSTFIRCSFSIPKGYPTNPPALVIEKSTSLSLKDRAYLLRNLRNILRSRAKIGKPSLEQALKFLLGEVTDVEAVEREETSDEEEEDGDKTGATPANPLIATQPEALREVRTGARWSKNG